MAKLAIGLGIIIWILWRPELLPYYCTEYQPEPPDCSQKKGDGSRRRPILRHEKTAIIAAMLLLGAARAGAQVDSSCLVLWQDSPLKPPGVVWFNSDSVKVDMCPGPEQYAEFAKNKFLVWFEYYIIPDSLSPTGDTLPHDWRDIDTAYSGIRNEFDSIEQRFGTFTIQHYNVGPRDTSIPGTKSWWVNFANYVNTDSTVHYLFKLPELDTNLGAYFEGRPLFYEGVKQNLTPNLIHIWPQPCSTEITLEGAEKITAPEIMDMLGRHLVLPIRFENDATLQIDLTSVPSGTYYARVVNDIMGTTVKFSVGH